MYLYLQEYTGEVCNRIHVPNTDPLILLPTLKNNRGINNCCIIISNKNSR